VLFFVRDKKKKQNRPPSCVFFCGGGGGGGTEIKLCDMSECIIRVGSMAVNG